MYKPESTRGAGLCLFALWMLMRRWRHWDGMDWVFWSEGQGGVWGIGALYMYAIVE